MIHVLAFIQAGDKEGLDGFEDCPTLQLWVKQNEQSKNLRKNSMNSLRQWKTNDEKECVQILQYNFPYIGIISEHTVCILYTKKLFINHL